VTIYCRQNRYGTSAGRTSYRRSLQPSKDNIQHFKTQKFFTFSIFVGLFSLLVPDLDPHSNCEFRSNSSNSNGSQDAVLEIRDIFVWIRIPGSAPLTNRSVSELWIWLLFSWILILRLQKKFLSYIFLELANIILDPEWFSWSRGARSFKRIWSPWIYFKVWIPPAYVAWRPVL